jgi:uncharacterized iron-regulated protein
MGAPLLLLIGAVAGVSSRALAAVPPPAPDCEAVERTALGAQRSQLKATADRLTVVLLGEVHTSAADHAWQLATLELLAQGRRPLALGVEMVPAPRQAVLTRYVNGQLDEVGLLAGVDWPAIWGHDPELYLPLLRWARGAGVPLLALNVEPEVVRRVRRQGLAAVSLAEREGIGPPAPAGVAYRQQLRAAWQAHGPLGASISPGGEVDLERFIDSQLLRDRAMAERLATAHKRDPHRLLVALMGRGHLEAEGGVPGQLRQLGLGPVAVLQRPEPPAGCGPPPPGARLGAYLESADGAVWVRRVAAGSVAAAAGLRPGDRLLAVNGEPVERAGQVIRRVREQPAGVPLRLTIEREGRRWQLELRLAPAGPADWPGRMGAAPPFNQPVAR